MSPSQNVSECLSTSSKLVTGPSPRIQKWSGDNECRWREWGYHSPFSLGGGGGGGGRGHGGLPRKLFLNFEPPQ